MKFRKNANSFKERVILSGMMLVIVFVLPAAHGSIGLAVAAALLMGAAMVMGILADKEYISMDEQGIVCSRGEQVLWQFAWDEIAELRHGRKNRRAVVEIVLKDGVLHPLSGISIHALCFEFCGAAKKAMDAYYR